MRLLVLAFASISLLVLPLAAGAEEGQARWEDFEDPAFDPAEPVAEATGVVSAKAGAIPLGPLGLDDGGVRGRIHTVSSGETLWDISDAYLGTPWVWPAVWSDNDGIDNPHVIEPGDQIWITSNEMRRVTPAEAEELVSSAIEPEVAEETIAAAFNEAPMEVPLEEAPLAEELPMLEPTLALETGEIVTIPRDQIASIVSTDIIDAAAKILDSPTIRVMLTQGDTTYLNLGAGEVSVGDEFSVFHKVLEIRDPLTRALLGHHVAAVGWLRVTAVEQDSCVAVIEEANDEMKRGDRLIPRIRVAREVTVRRADPRTVGHIALSPSNRYMVGTTDSVYVNLGSIHGIELGTKLSMYSGTNDSLNLLGAVVAEMVVIKVEPEVSVAFVTKATQELQVGDEVRGSPLEGIQQAQAY